MVKKLKSVLFVLVLAISSGVVLAGGPEVWPYNVQGTLQDDPPAVAVFVAGGLPLGVVVDP